MDQVAAAVGKKCSHGARAMAVEVSVGYMSVGWACGRARGWEGRAGCWVRGRMGREWNGRRGGWDGRTWRVEREWGDGRASGFDRR
jgi:hypothetical protein